MLNLLSRELAEGPSNIHALLPEAPGAAGEGKRHNRMDHFFIRF
jgi:hypothetical protein